jgi:hypothetical protein
LKPTLMILEHSYPHTPQIYGPHGGVVWSSMEGRSVAETRRKASALRLHTCTACCPLCHDRAYTPRALPSYGIKPQGARRALHSHGTYILLYISPRAFIATFHHEVKAVLSPRFSGVTSSEKAVYLSFTLHSMSQIDHLLIVRRNFLVGTSNVQSSIHSCLTGLTSCEKCALFYLHPPNSSWDNITCLRVQTYQRQLPRRKGRRVDTSVQRGSEA